jgi:hypothetical protein
MGHWRGWPISPNPLSKPRVHSRSSRLANRLLVSKHDSTLTTFGDFHNKDRVVYRPIHPWQLLERGEPYQPPIRA